MIENFIMECLVCVVGVVYVVVVQVQVDQMGNVYQQVIDGYYYCMWYGIVMQWFVQYVGLQCDQVGDQEVQCMQCVMVVVILDQVEQFKQGYEQYQCLFNVVVQLE